MKTLTKLRTHYDFFEIVNCFLSKKCRPLERFLNSSHTLEAFFKIPKQLSMNIIKPALPMAMLFLVSSGCQETIETQPTEPSQVSVTNKKVPRSDYQLHRNGKIKFASQKEDIFVKSSLDSLDFPELDDKLVQALENQLKVLRLRKNRKNQRVAGIDVSIDKLERTIHLLLEKAKSSDDYLNLNNEIAAYQTWGKDKKGHVNFTGYFAPEINVKAEADETYQYPLYTYPDEWEGKLPTRKEIDGEGALEGMGLELAYAKNLVDIYYMQLQGSGYVNFVDTGKKTLFRFDGGNGHKYRSIERFIMRNDDIKLGNITMDGIKNFLSKNPELMDTVLYSNPSYSFFRPSRSSVKGAGGVSLMEDISIAVDPDYFPLGSVILASVPTYNKKGNFAGHEFRLLLAQDVGGAINGAGHVDVYSGVGNKGKVKATMRHHYGNMWLLLPKENTQLAMK